MLDLNHPLELLKGADYNPRRIDESAIDRLRHSLAVLGVCKPIIVRRNVIVAGHQRTRALRAAGVTHAPCYLLDQDTTTYDEVRFNQLHNGTDLDTGDEAVTVKLPAGASGFVSVEADDITGSLLCRGAKIRAEICRLIIAYGTWGSAVATDDGEIIHAAQYALACKQIGKPCLIYVLPSAKKGEARALLGASYGVFSYDHIERDSFVQTFAQMFRLRGTAKDNRSPTYEQLVKPWMEANPGARVLDFGCGQGDYVKALRQAGHNIIGLEFFRRKGDAIDVDQVNRMVDQVISSIRRHGRFDAIVMDYVLNSVDSQQAEEDVLNSIDALCKPGGRLFFSGRSLERVQEVLRHRQADASRQPHRHVEFLDENGLTALYRKGSWFFQKFHGPEDVRRFMAARGWTTVREIETSIGWNVEATSGPRLTNIAAVQESLTREFDLPMNRTGRRLGRHQDILEALTPCLL
jgi:ParB family transcriptional regulator, chromosome partitioning protein